MSARDFVKNELMSFRIEQVRELTRQAEARAANLRGFADQVKRDLAEWEETLSVRKEALAEMESKAHG